MNLAIQPEEATMKSRGPQRDSTRIETPMVKSQVAHFSDGKVPVDYIATAAYYGALSRGFEPGKEIEDRRDAEAELRKQTAG